MQTQKRSDPCQGKRFEGGRHVPYFFYKGFGDIVGGNQLAVEVLPEDRELFPELGKKQWVILCIGQRGEVWESRSGRNRRRRKEGRVLSSTQGCRIGFSGSSRTLFPS